MNICIYICICISTFIFIYIDIFTYKYLYIYICIFIYIYICICICKCKYLYIYIYIFVFMYFFHIQRETIYIIDAFRNTWDFPNAQGPTPGREPWTCRSTRYCCLRRGTKRCTAASYLSYLKKSHGIGTCSHQFPLRYAISWSYTYHLSILIIILSYVHHMFCMNSGISCRASSPSPRHPG